MTAKQWLSRARWINREIRELSVKEQEARDRLTKITQSYESDGAQMTKDPHKFDRLVEYQSMIEENLAEQATVKSEIMAAIYQLKDRRQRLILMGRYLDMKKWEQIAYELNYSYMNVTRIHGYALQEVQKIIGKDK